MDLTPHTRIMMRACQKVRRAVVKGKLVNLRATVVYCVDCGVERATRYDHRDYTKPLEVAPVCNGCNIRRGRGESGINMPSRPKPLSLPLISFNPSLPSLNCALLECNRPFNPKRSWQVCCCKEHGRRLRYVRRRDRLMVARLMNVNKEEVMRILREPGIGVGEDGRHNG